MFMRIQERKAGDGTTRYYATVMRSYRDHGRVRQRVVATIGRVPGESVPYLKAAFAKHKPRLVWDEDDEAGQSGEPTCSMRSQDSKCH